MDEEPAGLSDDEEAHRARCLRRAAIRGVLAGGVGAAGASVVVFAAGFGFQFASFAQGLFAAALVAAVSWVELRTGPKATTAAKRLGVVALAGALAALGAGAGQIQSAYAHMVYAGHGLTEGLSKSLELARKHVDDPRMMLCWCLAMAIPFMVLTWLRLREASVKTQVVLTSLVTFALSCPVLYLGYRGGFVYWHDVKYVSTLAVGAALTLPILYLAADRLEAVGR